MQPRTYIDSFARNLRTLVTLLCCEEANHARTTLNLAKEMNRYDLAPPTLASVMMRLTSIY